MPGLVGGLLVAAAAGFLQHVADAGTQARSSVHKGNLWIDTSGGSCARSAKRVVYSDRAACQSLQAAGAAASSGDLILVKDGRYPGQLLTGSKKLAFVGAGPGRPAFGQIITSASNFTLRHVLVENRDAPATTVCSYFDYTLFTCGANQTYDDVIVDALKKGSGDPSRRGGLEVEGTSTNLVFKNGEIRNVSDSKGFQGGADGMIIDNNTFHDIRLTPAGGAAGVHNECAYVTGGDRQTWRRNRFLRCPVMAMFFANYIGGPPFSNVTIENNLFTHTLNEVGGWHNGAAFVIPNGAGGQNQVNNWVVRYNTFEVPPDFGPTPGTGDDNGSARFYGNLGSDGSCRAKEWTYRYNVGKVCGGTGEISVSGATNDSSHPNQAPFYVNAPVGNFQLRRNSLAINRGDPGTFPPSDATRRSRLIGSAPDAGAYEFRGGSATTGILAISSRPVRGVSRGVRAFGRQNPVSRTLALGSGGAHSAGRVRSVQLIVLASNPGAPTELRWLKRMLTRKSALVRIVVGRGAPYLCGTGTRAVQKLIQRYAARLVVSAGPAGIRTCAGSDPAREVARPTRAFVYVTVDVGGVLVRAVDASGRVTDRARIG